MPGVVLIFCCLVIALMYAIPREDQMVAMRVDALRQFVQSLYARNDCIYMRCLERCQYHSEHCGCYIHAHWTALTKHLECQPPITALHITMEATSSNYLLALARFIRTTTTLARFVLTFCPLTDVAWADVLDAIANNTTLTTLSFNDIRNAPAPAKLLAPVLSKNRTILDLTINNCLADIDQVAHALRHNSTLLRLSVTQSYVHENALGKLADALRTNKTLQFLDICGMKTSQTAQVDHIAQIIRCNTGLRTLLLNGEPVSFEKQEQLHAALRANHRLMHVEFEKAPDCPQTVDPWLIERRQKLEAAWRTLLMFAHWRHTDVLSGYARDFARYHLFPELCSVPW